MTALTPRTKPPSLMTLPVEVREIIYRYVFSYDKPLYTSSFGRLVINSEARHDMPCLRTCKKFYIEATPQIPAVNVLEISHRDTAALSRLPEFAEILVVIQCEGDPGELLAAASRAGIAGTRETESGRQVEDIDFGAIGKACPYVSDFEILTYFSGSLLWVTQKLLKSLPCSPIREWPLLRVDVTISEDEAFDNSNFTLDSTCKAVFHGDGPRQLTWLNACSGFRLGQEMPKALKSIRVQGTVSKRISKMIQNHSCSYGDCSFEKKRLPESTRRDDLGRTHEEEGEMSQTRYTWHKTEVREPDEAQAAKVMAAMNQWIPRLTQEDYERMARCGLEVSPEKYTPFWAAKLP